MKILNSFLFTLTFLFFQHAEGKNKNNAEGRKPKLPNQFNHISDSLTQKIHQYHSCTGA
jgi:hypothetical protein